MARLMQAPCCDGASAEGGVWVGRSSGFAENQKEHDEREAQIIERNLRGGKSGRKHRRSSIEMMMSMFRGKGKEKNKTGQGVELRQNQKPKYGGYGNKTESAIELDKCMALKNKVKDKQDGGGGQYGGYNKNTESMKELKECLSAKNGGERRSSLGRIADNLSAALGFKKKKARKRKQ